MSRPGASLNPKPARYLDHPCPTCGTTRALLNGAYLRHLREQAGVGLRELAQRAELSPSYLCDLEHNTRNLTEKLFKRFEEVL